MCEGILQFLLSIIKFTEDLSRKFFLRPNDWRYEHVADFGALLYQTTPKLDASLKAK
jgi:hypothetical protein